MKRRPATAPPLAPDEAVVLVGAVFLLFHLMGLLLSVPSWTLHWLLIALPVLVFLRWRGAAMGQTLSLRTPTPLHLVGTVLFGLGVIGIAFVYMAVQAAVLERFAFYREEMAVWEGRLTAESAPHLLWLIFTVALTPAICEELLFRGVLVSSLRRLMTPARTCVITGLLFGLFHVSPLQLVPVALIGMTLAWLVLVTGSLWTCILFHFLFNLATLLARHLPAGDPAPADPALTIAVVTLGSAALLAVGLIALWPRRPSVRAHGHSRTRLHDCTSTRTHETGVNP